MTVITNLPDLHPNLVLDFANSRGVDPRIKFSRASTATYFDEFGVMHTAPAGVPRIDYDPATGECRGLLVEEQRTNLLTYSEQFDNASWTKLSSTVTPGAAIAPTGINTAYKLTESTSTAQHRLHQILSGTNNNLAHTLSLYAKAGEATRIYVGIVEGSPFNRQGNAIFDLTTGAVLSTTTGSNGATGGTAAITHVGNGWYRCSYSVLLGGSSDKIYADINLAKGSQGIVYPGDGTSGLYIWGAQLEVGAFPTSYIPSSVTFTGRASAGTYIGSDGLIKTAASGEARYQYNPLNLKLAPKLLLEEQRTNLLLYSEQFDNAVWGNSNTLVTPNAVNAPDRTVTADKLIVTNANSTHFNGQTHSYTLGKTYTLSVFAKAGEYTWMRLYFGAGGVTPINARSASFNLANGTLGTVPAGVTASISAAGSGWYRCSITVTAVSSGVDSCGINVQNADSLNSISFAGNNSDGIYIWGAQLEEGSYPTSYIKTEAAQATRVADSSTSAQTTRSGEVASMTGASFSDWYRQDAGTFMVDYRCAHIGGPFYPSAWYVQSDMSNRFGHSIPNANKNVFYDSVIGGVTTVELGFANTKDDVKSAFAYKLNDAAVSTFGSSVLTDTSTPIPFVNRLEVGHRNNIAQLNGHIRRIAYYPQRITNEQLQTLTTI